MYIYIYPDSIYIYICICMYMYVCIYVSMYLCIYVSMYLCIYVSMYVCMYVCMHVCMYVCKHIWMFPGMMVPGTPKSSILKGFSLINHPFWGYPPLWKSPYSIIQYNHNCLKLTWQSCNAARCGQTCYGLMLSRFGQRATALNTHITQDFQKLLVGKLHMEQWSDNSGIACVTREALFGS